MSLTLEISLNRLRTVQLEQIRQRLYPQLDGEQAAKVIFFSRIEMLLTDLGLAPQEPMIVPVSVPVLDGEKAQI